MKGAEAIAVFRDYHAGLIADVAGNTAEAEKRLKAAYQAESKTLRMVDVYGRFLARRGRTEEAQDRLPRLRQAAAPPSADRRRAGEARSGQAARKRRSDAWPPARPRCSTASARLATGRATRSPRCSTCAWRCGSTPGNPLADHHARRHLRPAEADGARQRHLRPAAGDFAPAAQRRHPDRAQPRAARAPARGRGAAAEGAGGRPEGHGGAERARQHLPLAQGFRRRRGDLHQGARLDREDRQQPLEPVLFPRHRATSAPSSGRRRRRISARRWSCSRTSRWC